MMSKEDRWVTFATGYVSKGPASAEFAAAHADRMEAEFSKRFPSEPTLAEQAKRLANERGCIGCVIVTPQEVAEACAAHYAATLALGQHIEFAMSQQSVVLGIGQSAQVVTEGEIVDDSFDGPEISEAPDANQGGELAGGTVLRLARQPEEPGAIDDQEAYGAALERGTIVPICDGPDCA